MSHDQRNGVHEPRSYVHSTAFVSVAGCVGHLDSSRLFVPTTSIGFRLDAASPAMNNIMTRPSPRRLVDHAGRDLPAVFGSRSTCIQAAPPRPYGLNAARSCWARTRAGWVRPVTQQYNWRSVAPCHRGAGAIVLGGLVCFPRPLARRSNVDELWSDPQRQAPRAATRWRRGHGVVRGAPFSIVRPGRMTSPVAVVGQPRLTWRKHEKSTAAPHDLAPRRQTFPPAPTSSLAVGDGACGPP